MKARPPSWAGLQIGMKNQICRVLMSFSEALGSFGLSSCLKCDPNAILVPVGMVAWLLGSAESGTFYVLVSGNREDRY